jgi:pimeloyl-ACP methyl ester carboxylesterase
MTSVPETRYVRSGSAHIAYQVLGTGPPDLLLMYGWGSHVEIQWEQPLFARFLHGLAAVGRLTFFDRRGVGLSDPGDETTTVEEEVR